MNETHGMTSQKFGVEIETTGLGLAEAARVIARGPSPARGRARLSAPRRTGYGDKMGDRLVFSRISSDSSPPPGLCA